MEWAQTILIASGLTVQGSCLDTRSMGVLCRVSAHFNGESLLNVEIQLEFPEEDTSHPQTGVAARLMRMNPHLVAIHCCDHREALAAEGAANTILYLKQGFFSHLEHVARFFRDSATRTAVFEREQRDWARTQQPPPQPVVKKLVVSAFTRWLTQDRVTDAIHARFIPLLNTLQQFEDVVAVGLYTQLCTFEFVGFLLIMRDTLPGLAMLSKCWQGGADHIETLELSLPQLIKQFDRQATQSSPSPAHSAHYLELGGFLAEVEAAGHAIRRKPLRCADWLRRQRKQYYAALRDQLNLRFPDVPLIAGVHRLLTAKHYDQAQPLLEKFIADNTAAVNELYGSPQLGKAAVLNTKRLRDELGVATAWMKLQAKKTRIVQEREVREQTDAEILVGQRKTYITKPVLKQLSVLDNIQEFLSTDSLVEVFPNLTTLMQLYAVLTLSSADCERCFSTMKATKTLGRNRLQYGTLNQLMQIELNGPDLNSTKANSVIERAIALFLGRKVRRLGSTPELKKLFAQLEETISAAAIEWGWDHVEATRALMVEVVQEAAQSGNKDEERQKLYRMWTGIARIENLKESQQRVEAAAADTAAATPARASPSSSLVAPATAPPAPQKRKAIQPSSKAPSLRQANLFGWAALPGSAAVVRVNSTKQRTEDSWTNKKQWKVKRLSNRRCDGRGGSQYLVEWEPKQDGTAWQDTWERDCNIDDDLIMEYWFKQPKKARTESPTSTASSSTQPASSDAGGSRVPAGGSGVSNSSRRASECRETNGLCGLHNLGNTCFLASAMQVRQPKSDIFSGYNQ